MQHTRWASVLTTGILVCAGVLTAAPASSAERAWTVSATAVTERVEQGQPAVVVGSVSPSSPGKWINLQVRANGRWVGTDSTRLSKDSTFRFNAMLQTLGRMKYRVSAPAGGGRASGHSDPFVLTLVAYPTPRPWGEIQMGEDHSCGLGDVDASGVGMMFCWGDNQQDEMGGEVSLDEVPVAVAVTRDTWTDVSSGNRFSCGIKVDSSLWCWGVNFNGQLGNGKDTNSEPLSNNSLGTGWTAVNSNNAQTCGVRAGDIYCWGAAWSMGSDGASLQRTPLRITQSGDWVQGLPDFGGLCALRVGGSVWCGQFGNGDVALTQVGSAADWVALSPRRDYEGICGLEASGEFSCFARDGSFTPSRALPGDVWTSVDTSEHTCGVQVDGSLWCKGPNRYGQLGNGTRQSSAKPVRVGSDTDWRQVTAGENATCATKDNGSNWCWGKLASGRLGYKVYVRGDEAIFQSTPLQVRSLF